MRGGKTSKAEAKELYKLAKTKNIKENQQLCSMLIGSMINNKVKDILFRAQVICSDSATYNQYRSFIRCIFGRYYNYSTWQDLMYILNSI